MSVRDSIVLASGSPRRRRMLEEAGLDIEVVPADVEEDMRGGEAPAELAIGAAGDKGLAVATRLAREGRRPWIVAADTIVVLGDDVLLKPRDADDARRMLERLSGRAHDVITGWALGRHRDSWIARSSLTRVFFHPLSEGEIDAYVETGEGADKAGAYAIQGIGAFLVDRIEGDYSNVVGLPISRVLRALVEVGAIGRYPG